jgi:hypothetical protein
MSTNYYCHIIPSKERKKELHDAIEANDFPLINKLKDEMYNSIRVEYGEDYIIGGVVHLGKRSSGWKFLWNPNVFVIRNGHLEDNNGIRKYVPDPDTPLYTYPLTKKGLKSFIDREDVLIYDEYDELQDKEEFWKMALEWGYKKNDIGWDADSYYKDHPMEHGYLAGGELIDLLIAEGYKLSRYNSDFYSDGLRFATSIEFS